MSENDKPGFGNPPKASRFKAGQSGNPRGRPKGTRNLRTDLADISSRRISVRENGKQRLISRQEALVLSLYNKALLGDVKAATSIVNMLVRFSAAAESVQEAPRLSEADHLIIENFLHRNLKASDEENKA